MGKLESGVMKRGDHLVLMPNQFSVEILNIYIENFPIDVWLDIRLVVM